MCIQFFWQYNYKKPITTKEKFIRRQVENLLQPNVFLRITLFVFFGSSIFCPTWPVFLETTAVRSYSCGRVYVTSNYSVFRGMATWCFATLQRHIFFDGFTFKVLRDISPPHIFVEFTSKRMEPTLIYSAEMSRSITYPCCATIEQLLV